MNRLDPSVKKDGLARDLLARAAFFAPGEAIPCALLAATLPEQPDELDLGDALQRLAALGLVGLESNGDPVIHRLVARYSGSVLADLDVLARVERTVDSEASKLNRAGFPGPLLVWQTHQRVITNRALGREDESTSRLCNNLGFHLKSLGNYGDARPYYEQALAIRMKVLGDQHPDTASSLNNLGALLQAMGELEAARPYYEQALAIRMKVLSDQHRLWNWKKPVCLWRRFSKRTRLK